jgi:hypothetical protein
MDKHSRLLQTYVKYGRKSFIALAPGLGLISDSFSSQMFKSVFCLNIRKVCIEICSGESIGLNIYLHIFVCGVVGVGGGGVFVCLCVCVCGCVCAE